MHDPYSQIFQINLSQKIVITLWHKDPCTDGTDDSCGRFKRSRHGDEETLIKIQKDFDFEYKFNHWFYPNGAQKFSTIGILVDMYTKVAWIHFGRNRKKVNRFMRKYIYDIISLAENDYDCIGNSITNKWNYEGASLKNERTRSLPSIIYGDVLRKTTKWWQHPNWHLHHWKFTFRFIRKSKELPSHADHNLRETV